MENKDAPASEMTKREKMAAMILAGYAANPDAQISSSGYERLSQWAVEQTDYLIKELAK